MEVIVGAVLPQIVKGYKAWIEKCTEIDDSPENVMRYLYSRNFLVTMMDDVKFEGIPDNKIK